MCIYGKYNNKHIRLYHLVDKQIKNVLNIIAFHRLPRRSIQILHRTAGSGFVERL